MYSAEMTQAYVATDVYNRTTWRGHLAIKCPLDLWMYQELIHRIRPDFFVELGTAWGGTALFLADLFEGMQHGEVIAVDIRDRGSYPEHPRLTRLMGYTAAEPIVREVHERVGRGTAIVCSDSSHGYEDTLAELRAYQNLVPAGSYFLVEDAWGIHQAAVERALKEFQKEYPEFSHDRSCEKFLISFTKDGYLKRKPQ